MSKNVDISEDLSLEDGFPRTESPENQDSAFETITADDRKQISTDTLLFELLGYFAKNTYDALSKDPRISVIANKARELLSKDYLYVDINNKRGHLSKYYPTEIPYLRGEKNGKSTVQMHPGVLRRLVVKAHNARCRQRFPVPVILCKGKFICRSATVSSVGEVYARQALDILASVYGGQYAEKLEDLDEKWIKECQSNYTESTDPNWRSVNEVQYADIKLLDELNVTMVVDLMVEDRKHKGMIPVTSSEKVVDSLYHNRFELASLPYPGCEFFTEFYANAHNPSGLRFDFDQPMCTAKLSIPRNPLPHINFNEYKQWELNTITRNYLMYILKSFQDSDSGILVHCISGWDRTPLFITLIRLSLWADGLIHRNLNASEILYFCIAYDWFLFGHHLSDRLSKSEDILLYCFLFLKEMFSDDFKVGPFKCGKEPPIVDDYELIMNLSLDQAIERDDRILAQKLAEKFAENNGNNLEQNKTEVENGNNLNKNGKNGNGTDCSTEVTGESETLKLDDANNPEVPEINVNPPLNEKTLGLPTVPLYYTKRPSLSPVHFDDPMSVTITTPPVDIPGRPKTEQCPVGSADSWQVVSGTGSVTYSGFSPPLDSPPTGMVTRKEVKNPESRREKLAAVRNLFYASYYKAIKGEIQYVNHPGIIQKVWELMGSLPSIF